MEAKIAQLRANPRPPWSRQLVNRSHNGMKVRRIRSGVYRSLYVVREEVPHILVLDIDHRKDVYRRR